MPRSRTPVSRVSPVFLRIRIPSVFVSVPVMTAAVVPLSLSVVPVLFRVALFMTVTSVPVLFAVPVVVPAFVMVSVIVVSISIVLPVGLIGPSGRLVTHVAIGLLRALLVFAEGRRGRQAGLVRQRRRKERLGRDGLRPRWSEHVRIALREHLWRRWTRRKRERWRNLGLKG